MIDGALFMTQAALYYIPCPDMDCAKTLARGLVSARLAPCVNILSSVTSVYMEEGALQESAECILIAKSTAAAFPDLEQYIDTHHPYTTPAIVQINPQQINATYLQWLLGHMSGGQG